MIFAVSVRTKKMQFTVGLSILGEIMQKKSSLLNMMQISLMFKLVTLILQTEQQQSTWFESISYIANILTLDN